MQRSKECVAMLLAGGQGSRLYALTNNIAKPAVPFGAKYRIIDFPLSNCINSGIDTVGVLTQYQPPSSHQIMARLRGEMRAHKQELFYYIRLKLSSNQRKIL